MGVSAVIRSSFASARARWTSPAIADGLFEACVTHVRYTPKHYALSHRLWYLHLPLAALDALPGPLLGYRRIALYSLNDRDHGTGKTQLALWISETLAEAGAPLADDDTVSLVTLPRILGLVFNPVSFWLCHDAGGALRTVLAEVNNTFGERHCYLCRKDDGSPIGAGDEITARKMFHVSPFLPVDGRYVFRFVEHNHRLGIFISLFRGEERVLFTSLTGELKTLDRRALAARAIRAPLPAALVLMFIHYHAARLYLRGIRLFSKPVPPAGFVTPGHSIDHETR